jgi:CheY-like chemotaxis protein
MNILILEDDPNRQRAFRGHLVGAFVVITDDTKTCIQHLQERVWDMLFLDHDLGGKIMQASGEGTGYEVAQWLANNPDRKPPVIVIHSMNPSGSQNMLSAIGEPAQCIPFYALKFRAGE